MVESAADKLVGEIAMTDTNAVERVQCLACRSTKALLSVPIYKLEFGQEDEYPELREICSECIRQEYLCMTHQEVHICADGPAGLRHICGRCIAETIRQLLPSVWVPMATRLGTSQVREQVVASALRAAGTEFIGLSMDQKALYGLYLQAHMLCLSPANLLEGYAAAAGHRAH